MNKEFFNTQWKILANNETLTSQNFIDRAIFIAMASKNKNNAPREDIILALLQKYFSPITNRNKLNNGQTSYAHINYARRSIQYTKPTWILGLPYDKLLSEEEYKEFCSYIKNLSLEKMDRKYIYYFTTQEGLTPEQQGVQAGHVLFKLGTKLGKKVDPDHTYFQWIGVKDDTELVGIINKHRLYPLETFRESDLGNRLTSVAFYPILWNKREDFLDYPLLTH